MALRTVGARAWTGLLRGVGHALPANKPGPALGLAFFSRPSSAAPPQAAAVLAARIGVSAPCACGTRRHLSSEAAASADAPAPAAEAAIEQVPRPSRVHTAVARGPQLCGTRNSAATGARFSATFEPR